jgi:hypothetical protein
MINITDYGLIEQDITRSLFEKLSLTGQEVYCGEMAKTKKRATHCFVYLNAGELKNTYWTLEADETSRVANFVTRKFGTLIEIKEMPDTPDKQAGLEAYRLRCLKTEEMWKTPRKNTSEGEISNAGANNFN